MSGTWVVYCGQNGFPLLQTFQVLKAFLSTILFGPPPPSVRSARRRKKFWHRVRGRRVLTARRARPSFGTPMIPSADDCRSRNENSRKTLRTGVREPFLTRGRRRTAGLDERGAPRSRRVPESGLRGTRAGRRGRVSYEVGVRGTGRGGARGEKRRRNAKTAGALRETKRKNPLSHRKNCAPLSPVGTRRPCGARYRRRSVQRDFRLIGWRSRVRSGFFVITRYGKPPPRLSRDTRRTSTRTERATVARGRDPGGGARNRGSDARVVSAVATGSRN